MYYQMLKTRFVVVGQEVWRSGNKATMNTDASSTLDRVMTYSAQNYQHGGASDPPDTVVYITNLDICSGNCMTIGIAGLGTMCNFYRGSASLNEDRGNVALTSSTIAHELGHTLSMEHDQASCTPGLGIMAPSAGHDDNGWSSCAKDYFWTFLESGAGGCLLDTPAGASAGAICGNGIVEKGGGEECDCGTGAATVSGCDNCCNPATCKLKAGKACAEGTCCNVAQCQFRPASFVCRAATSECDVDETCPGSDAVCPGNVHRADGTACGINGAGSVCVNGQCSSFDQQCVKLWGSGSTKAEDACWNSNKDGDEFGNCGQDKLTDTFVACSEADKFCGSLQCKVPQFPCTQPTQCPTSLSKFGQVCFGGSCMQDPNVAGSASTSQKTFVDSGGNSITCNLVSQDLGEDIPDPGMVQDGVSCALNKVCMGGKCVSVSAVAGPPPPGGPPPTKAPTKRPTPPPVPTKSPTHALQPTKGPTAAAASSPTAKPGSAGGGEEEELGEEPKTELAAVLSMIGTLALLSMVGCAFCAAPAGAGADDEDGQPQELGGGGGGAAKPRGKRNMLKQLSTMTVGRWAAQDGGVRKRSRTEAILSVKEAVPACAGLSTPAFAVLFGAALVVACGLVVAAAAGLSYVGAAIGASVATLVVAGFMCYASCQRGGGGGDAGGWSQYLTPDGDDAFYNERTGETTYDRPAALDRSGGGGACGACLRCPKRGGGGGGGGGLAAKDGSAGVEMGAMTENPIRKSGKHTSYREALAGVNPVRKGDARFGGWTSHFDEETGAKYFYHEASGRTQWDMPEAWRQSGRSHALSMG